MRSGSALKLMFSDADWGDKMSKTDLLQFEANTLTKMPNVPNHWNPREFGCIIVEQSVCEDRIYMNPPANKLPEFDAPPLEESILSVEFERLADWKIPHYGAFWTTIRESYPKADAQVPLAPAPNDPTAPASLRISTGDTNLARACCVNESGTMQVQVQNDRFLTTWARKNTTDEYPRYRETRPNFERKWGLFLKFIEKEGLPSPRPTRCEITYVNHVGSTGDWSALQSPERIFAPWSGKQTNGYLPKPNMVSAVTQYAMPEGELTVALQPAIRVSDNSKLVQLILVARLPLREGANTQSILHCFDLGREWIVRGFADITTTELQSIWKRKD